MFREIVFPQDNEIEFVELASRLGLKKIYFLYDFDEFTQKNIQKKLDSISIPKNADVQIGFAVNQKNISKALKQSKLLIAKSSYSDRFFIESNKVKFIYGFEELYKNDYLHQRASGLNHVLCKLCKKHGVAVGFSYGTFLHKNSHTTPLILGRAMQNIALCSKYKVKTVIGSLTEKPFELRLPHDVMSLFSLLGMNNKYVKDSISSDL